MKSFQSLFEKQIELVKIDDFLMFDDCFEACLGSLQSRSINYNQLIGFLTD